MRGSARRISHPRAEVKECPTCLLEMFESPVCPRDRVVCLPPRLGSECASISHRVGGRCQVRQRSSDSQSSGAPIDSIVRACEVGNFRSSAASCSAQSVRGPMAGRRYAMTASAL